MSESKFQDFSFANKTYAKFRFDQFIFKVVMIRPEYPDYLFEEVVKRVEGPRDLAVDVGAGTGQATIPLAAHFKKVIGFDPSVGQLEQTQKQCKHFPKNDLTNQANIEFRQSTAEKIDLPSSTVDLLVSAQAVHWFNTPEFYNEVIRLLRPGGLMALWGYGLCTLDNKDANDALRNVIYK